MKIVKYSLVALFAFLLAQYSFAASNENQTTIQDNTKPSCGCQHGKGTKTSTESPKPDSQTKR